MRDFFNKIRFYIFSGEFLFFLAFLILAVPLIFLGFSYAPRNLAVINLIGFLIIAAIVFISGLILSQKRFSLEIGHHRLNSIVNNLRDGIISYSEGFRILSFNPAAEQIFNLKKEEVIGLIISPQLSSDSKFKTLAQVFFPSLAPAVSRKSEPGTYPQIIDISFSEPKLELRVSTDRLTTEGQPINQKGEIIGFVKIVHNRTRELEILKSKSEFVTIAAHQLRTPLTAINWIFEILKNSKSMDKSDLEMAISGSAAGLKLLNIIDGLLDVAKIEEGRFGYNFESIDIVAFLENAVRNFVELAKNYGVSISFNKPSSPIMILADPKNLNIVVSNLLDNAVKYNVKNGQIIVDLRVFSDKPYVQISIKDTGIGMSGEDLNKLFTKFHRGENALKLQTEGSGLGLYIVKNVISRHGGQIWAESILNRGTTFYFVLPTDPKLIPQKEIAYSED